MSAPPIFMEPHLFTFVKVRLELKAVAGSTPPPAHLYSLLARLEDEFLATGNRGQGCPVCGIGHRTAADDLFGRSLPSDPVAVRRFQKPAPPLILRPPATTAPLKRGAPVFLEMVLVGNSSIHLGELMAHLPPLLARDGISAAEGGGKLLGIPGQGELPLETHHAGAQSPLIINDLEDLIAAFPPSSSLTFNLQTPLRLVEGNRLTHRFDFSLFVRTLMRRVSSLAYQYCSHEFPVEYDHLSLLSRELDVSDATVRFEPGTSMATAGFVGSFTVCGDMMPLMPFLVAGTICNAGKGASAGFGRYALSR